MTEHDPLELELAGLRPHAPSAALKQRIAEQLAPPLVPVQRRWTLVGQASAVAGLLAASVMAIALWQSREETVPPVSTPTSLDPYVASGFESSSPSAWSYGRALTRSPEAMDALLDVHAQRLRRARSSAEPVVVLAFFNSEIDSLLGDM